MKSFAKSIRVLFVTGLALAAAPAQADQPFVIHAEANGPGSITVQFEATAKGLMILAVAPKLAFLRGADLSDDGMPLLLANARIMTIQPMEADGSQHPVKLPLFDSFEYFVQAVLIDAETMKLRANKPMAISADAKAENGSSIISEVLAIALGVRLDIRKDELAAKLPDNRKGLSWSGCKVKVGKGSVDVYLGMQQLSPDQAGPATRDQYVTTVDFPFIEGQVLRVFLVGDGAKGESEIYLLCKQQM